MYNRDSRIGDKKKKATHPDRARFVCVQLVKEWQEWIVHVSYLGHTATHVFCMSVTVSLHPTPLGV